MRRLNRAAPLVIALALVGTAISGTVNAQVGTATRTYHRAISVYVGTWTVFVQGNPNPVGTQAIVEFTDHITAGVSNSIQFDATADARVKSAAPLWIFPPGLTNIEWVLLPTDNLPALANFNAAVAALGGSITSDTGFLPLPGSTHLLDSFDTTETGPVSCGDPDGAVCGSDGQTLNVTNNFVADVSYYERNGSVTLPAVSKCPLSHGYWKNNLGLWTVGALTLGTQAYAKPELLALLGSPSTKDASVVLGKQLIAAKLNVGYGANPTPIAATLATANALLGSLRVPANVKPSSAQGKAMTAAAQILDDYNNGRLTTICLP